MLGWLLLAAIAAPAAAAPAAAGGDDIGYPSVAAAGAALRARGLSGYELDGWLYYLNGDTGVSWKFTQPGNPAHPSVIKTAACGQLRVRCEGARNACSTLIAETQHLRDQLAPFCRQQAELEVARARQAAAAAPMENLGMMGEIRIAAGSEASWLPARDQLHKLEDALQAFLNDLDEGQYARAYARIEERPRALMPLERFTQRAQDFSKLSGTRKQQRIERITWAKDPPDAPASGVYAVVELASRFARIQHHCGFALLHQRDPASPFHIVRQEDFYLTDDQAQQMTTSQAPVEQLWASLRQSCRKPAEAVGLAAVTADALVSFTGHGDRCDVTTVSDPDPRPMRCRKVASYLMQNRKLPKGAYVDEETAPDVNVPDHARVISLLREAGYRPTPGARESAAGAQP
jgi:hypothetical protein